ncbi:MAG: hypothetical protein O2783_08195 [Chloroflexi bacterium]|nr:hypothetical protein [Chloroflexota bacterium]
MTAQGLSDLLGGRAQGDFFMARCPAHADRSPSLCIRQGNSKVLVWCYAGCTYDEILEAAGVESRDLSNGPSLPSHWAKVAKDLHKERQIRKADEWWEESGYTND